MYWNCSENEEWEILLRRNSLSSCSKTVLVILSNEPSKYSVLTYDSSVSTLGCKFMFFFYSCMKELDPVISLVTPVSRLILAVNFVSNLFILILLQASFLYPPIPASLWANRLHMCMSFKHHLRYQVQWRKSSRSICWLTFTAVASLLSSNHSIWLLMLDLESRGLRIFRFLAALVLKILVFSFRTWVWNLMFSCLSDHKNSWMNDEQVEQRLLFFVRRDFRDREWWSLEENMECLSLCSLRTFLVFRGFFSFFFVSWDELSRLVFLSSFPWFLFSLESWEDVTKRHTYLLHASVVFDDDDDDSYSGLFSVSVLSFHVKDSLKTFLKQRMSLCHLSMNSVLVLKHKDPSLSVFLVCLTWHLSWHLMFSEWHHRSFIISLLQRHRWWWLCRWVCLEKLTVSWREEKWQQRLTQRLTQRLPLSSCHSTLELHDLFESRKWVKVFERQFVGSSHVVKSLFWCLWQHDMKDLKKKAKTQQLLLDIVLRMKRNEKSKFLVEMMFFVLILKEVSNEDTIFGETSSE